MLKDDSTLRNIRPELSSLMTAKCTLYVKIVLVGQRQRISVDSVEFFTISRFIITYASRSCYTESAFPRLQPIDQCVSADNRRADFRA